MKTLVLNSNDLAQLINLDELRAQMQKALKGVSLDLVFSGLRHVVGVENHNALGFMPSQSTKDQLLGYKIVSVFPGNMKHNLNPHQGLMSLLCTETGRIKALMDGSTLTAFRTAAVSAMATEVLSRQNSKVLAVLGSGLQALQHIRAILRVRNIEKIKIYARDPEKVAQIRTGFSSEVEFEHCLSAADAVANSDVIVTCTSSSLPIIDSGKFPLGVHVNAVGACRPGYREVNLKFHPFLRIFLDHHPSCMIEADEVFRPEGGESARLKIVGELGEVLANRIAGREGEDEITFFKSVGLAAEDLFAAQMFFDRAVQNKIGTYIQF